MTGNIGLELSQFSPFIQDGSFEMKNNVVATMITLTICASFPVIAVSAQTNPDVAPDAVTQKCGQVQSTRFQAVSRETRVSSARVRPQKIKQEISGLVPWAW